MDDYTAAMRGYHVGGIPAEHWISFFKLHAEAAHGGCPSAVTRTARSRYTGAVKWPRPEAWRLIAAIWSPVLLLLAGVIILAPEGCHPSVVITSSAPPRRTVPCQRTRAPTTIAAASRTRFLKIYCPSRVSTNGGCAKTTAGFSAIGDIAPSICRYISATVTRRNRPVRKPSAITTSQQPTNETNSRSGRRDRSRRSGRSLDSLRARA